MLYFLLSYLKKHDKIHTGDKPFNCSQCDYKDSTSGHLKRHERHHNSINLSGAPNVTRNAQHQAIWWDMNQPTTVIVPPLYWSNCTYRCSREDVLKHERTHAGEKSLSCFQCGYKCTRLEVLKMHERTHSGDEPFSSSQCESHCVTTNFTDFYKRWKNSQWW